MITELEFANFFIRSGCTGMSVAEIARTVLREFEVTPRIPAAAQRDLTPEEQAELQVALHYTDKSIMEQIAHDIREGTFPKKSASDEVATEMEKSNEHQRSESVAVAPTVEQD